MNDILLNTDFDLDIQNGDFVIGRSDEQQQEVLMLATQGDFKQNPEVGIDLISFINESEIEKMVDAVREQFTYDGMKVSKVSYDEQTGDLDYDAVYK
jgi:hypothetical protein